MTVRARALALSAQGRSDNDVAEAVGVSARTVRRWRTNAGQPSRWTPTPPPHGTRARYQRGCVCPQCRRANAVYSTQTRAAYARALRQRQGATGRPTQ